MVRILVLIFWTTLLVFSVVTPLRAGPVEESIARQLQNQGFRDITVRRTFLGRSRITAKSDRFEREIIVNPRTGEILRDYTEQINGTSGPVILAPQLGEPIRNAGDSDPSRRNNSGHGNAEDNDESDRDARDDVDQGDDPDDGDGADDADDGDDGDDGADPDDADDGDDDD